VSVTLRGVTDTPPSPQSVPYVPGRLGQEAIDGGAAGEPQTDSLPPASSPPPRRSKTPLLVGGLAVLVVALAGTVVVLATRTSADAPNAAASPSPSWTSVFATTEPAAAYSPPPPKEVSAPFGQTLTLSGRTDEVNFTVTADKTYAKTKYGTKPKNGLLYGIKVTVEVIEGSAYACACDFAFVAADGTVYEGTGVSVDGGLDGVELNRKQKAVGIVVFDIPPAAVKGARIELREGSNNQGFWEVP
jgi:hypothetical protein